LQIKNNYKYFIIFLWYLWGYSRIRE